MNNKFRTWHEAEVEYLRNHPDEIQGYLDVAFEEAERDGDWGAFLESLRAVTDAKGGMTELARKLDCSRSTLYKTLSAEGTPRLDTLASILQELGLRLSIQTVKE